MVSRSLLFGALAVAAGSVMVAAAAPHVVFVSPSGSDSASGASAATALASCAAAVKKTEALLKAGLLAGGVEVRFAAGTSPLNTATACGSVSFSGSAAAPVVFRGPRSGRALFDATAALDTSTLKPVTNATVKALLNPSARDKIMAMPVPKSALPLGQLEWNGVPLISSSYPNTGLAYVRRVLDAGAVYANGEPGGYTASAAIPIATC